MNKNGYFLFVLHSHIPYVLKHGEWPHGEYWLFEAAAETYIPLLQMLERIKNKGKKTKITIGLTPVLLEQLRSEYFKEKFNEYLEFKISLIEKDKTEFESKGESDKISLSLLWEKFYNDLYHLFNFVYGKDIVLQFKKFQDSGNIEILTSAATHAYLPLLGYDNNVRAQIKAGIETYIRHFGKKPSGIWLPECAYRPEGQWRNPVTGEEFFRKGIDKILVEEGIMYTFIDSPNLNNASLFNQYSQSNINPQDFKYNKTPFLPYKLKSGLTLFVRDHKTGVQVWDKRFGYPGDGYYLEFHKQKDTSGIKYWRITDSSFDLGQKQLYNPEKAKERVKENSEHFARLITDILTDFRKTHNKTGILVSPFDAELFGHWWFEGPMWLEKVIENLSIIDGIEPATPSTIIKQFKNSDMETINLKEGSWGENNDHSVWLNNETRWTWEKLYKVERDFIRFLKLHKAKIKKDLTLYEILREGAKALVITEASDWQFLIHKNSAIDYVTQRFTTHLNEVNKTLEIAKNYLATKKVNEQDRKLIKKLKEKNIAFNTLRLEWYLED